MGEYPAGLEVFSAFLTSSPSYMKGPDILMETPSGLRLVRAALPSVCRGEDLAMRTELLPRECRWLRALRVREMMMFTSGL